MGIYLGLKIQKVWVNPNVASGRCFFFLNGDRVVHAAVLLAGSEAEQLWAGRKRREITKDDFNDLKRLKVSQRGVQFLHPRVKEVVRKNKGSIIKLAKVLFSEHKVSAERLREVLNLRKNYWR